MIEANQLRIGNTVRVCIEGKDGIFDEFATIKEIRESIIIVGNGLHAGYHMLQPITLNELILNKCGLKWHDPSSCYVDQNMFEIAKEEGIYPDYFLWHRNGMVGRNPIHYLHELQNLYFIIMGKELEVNL